MAWHYEGKVITEITDMPEGTIGFVYMITNKEDGKFYIGKKSLYSHRTLPPLKGYKRKRKVIKESNWRHYNSSNKEVASWTETHKKILRFCFSKKGTNLL